MRSGADDASTHPLRFKIVYSSSRGKGDPTRGAVQQSAGRTALQGAIRSGNTRSTGVRPPSTARRAASPWPCPCARPAPAPRAPSSPRSRSPASAPRSAPTSRPARGSRSSRATRSTGWRNAREKRVRLGDRDWTIAVGQPEARQGLALATLLVGGLLTILIGVVGSQSRRRERDALGVIAMRRAERDERRAGPARGGGALARAGRDLHRPDLRARAGRLVRYVSPACRELLGLEPEALLGRRSPTSCTRTTPRAWRAALGGGEDAPVVDHATGCAAAARSGSRRGCASSATPRPRALVETHATVRDVADRMRVAAPRWPRPRSASAPPSRRRRSAWRSTRLDGRFLRVNRALCADHRLRARASSRAARAARSPTRTTSSADRDGARPRCSRASVASYRAEKRYLHADGHVVWVAVELDARARRRRQAAALPLPGAGRHRAPPLRGRAAPPGRPRPADRPAQPPRASSASSSATSSYVGALRRRAARRSCSTSTTSSTINDTLGHCAGDELIVRVADALREPRCARPTCSRASAATSSPCCCPTATPRRPTRSPRELLDGDPRACASRPRSGPRRGTVTASIGVALFDSADGSPARTCSSTPTSRCTTPRRRGRDRSAVYDAPARPASRASTRASRGPTCIRDALDEDALRAARAADRRPRHRRASTSTSCCCACATPTAS